MAPVQRVSSIRIDTNPPRTNVMVLNRGKPLADRPIINYTPAEATVEYLYSDTMVPQSLGLINPTGVLMLITDTRAGTATYGVRDMQVAYAPTNSANYNGLYDLKSGVLTSYSLQGGVTDPVRASFSLQFLDWSGSVYTAARDTTNYAAAPVKPENQLLTGLGSSSTLFLTGLGLTGLTIQSFSFSVGFNRASVMEMGKRFPIERPFTDVAASLQVQGFFEGLNNSVTGINAAVNCGAPMGGTVALTMTPSCGVTSPSSVTMINPYVDNLSINGQVGNFSTFSASFSLPIGPNPLETSDGSVVILT